MKKWDWDDMTPAQRRMVVDAESLSRPRGKTEAEKELEAERRAAERRKLTVPAEQILDDLAGAYPAVGAWIGEVKVVDGRRWRFDYAFIKCRLAVELEGGIWKVTSGGRSAGHANPVRFISDVEKYNTAAALGWYVLRFTGEMINNGYMRQALADFVHFHGLE